jgi:alanine racemase
MATLAEIASYAGVSQATVSRVLNGKPGVSDSARQTVITALDVLGYERPARLKRRSAGLVGLVVPELENPIFPAFAQVIETALAQKGFTPVLCTQTPGGVTEDEYVETLLDHGVAGIIFVSGRHSDTSADLSLYRKLVEQRVPVVMVNGYAADVDAPFISDDDEAAMELAVSHLVQLGHHKIGLAVGPARYVPTQRKSRGFVAAMERHLGSGLDPQAWVEGSLFTLEGGHAAARSLVDRGATAIVCGSDLIALGAIRACRQAGLRVPEDVSVVGYDDSRLVAFVDPPLTTVRQAVGAMGAAAVDALSEAIHGRPIPSREYVFRPDLVLRSSTAAPPRPKGRRRS